jgi:Transport and Golgi organisation 2
MCSVVILRRPGHDWPVLLGANRDEMSQRPWLPPARHWPDRPWVVAGLDQQAGGSWLGLNDHGLVAGIMNRPQSLGPAAGKRSRGELVLEALDHADARAAAAALAELDPDAYRPFNLILADNTEAFWIRHAGASIDAAAIPPGLSMLTAHDLNDAAGSRRIGHFLPLFRAAPAPDPAAGDWRAWQALLGSRSFAPGAGPLDAMTILGENGFATLSSALIALPGPGIEAKPVLLFAAGRPDVTPYEAISL